MCPNNAARELLEPVVEEIEKELESLEERLVEEYKEKIIREIRKIIADNIKAYIMVLVAGKEIEVENGLMLTLQFRKERNS
ncbi:MAG: hypothetical protein U9Q07_05405 [Planctomycetota bacterium]|nr:hypothetical protein [Planctomycetota bacterium]